MSARFPGRAARGAAWMGAALALAGMAAAPAPAADPPSLAVRGEQVFKEQGCYGCHTVGAMGTPIASDLGRIGARHDRAYLSKWLRDPTSQRPTAHMPKISLTEAEADALAAYLASLR